jgi:hypothetical protein
MGLHLKDKKCRIELVNLCSVDVSCRTLVVFDDVQVSTMDEIVVNENECIHEQQRP